LDLEDIKILNLEAIWNFGKGTELSWADIRLWATKRPSIGPRCIGTVRVRTQCTSIYLLTYQPHIHAPAKIGLTIPARDRPQTRAFDRAATWIERHRSLTIEQ